MSKTMTPLQSAWQYTAARLSPRGTTAGRHASRADARLVEAPSRQAVRMIHTSR